MRYNQLQTNRDRLLNEVRMAPSNLQQFLQTPLAKSMKAGFEAELIFVDANSDYEREPEYEPDYDFNEQVNDIDDIIEFFGSGDFAEFTARGNSGQRERERLQEKYYEWLTEKLQYNFEQGAEEYIRDWIEENDWDEDSELETVLSEDMDLSDEEVAAALEAGSTYAGKITSSKQQRELRKENEAYNNFLTAADVVDEKLQQRIDDAVSEINQDWENAWEEWRENNGDDYSERDWLRDIGITTASDAESEFGFSWPHYINTNEDDDGEFNSEAAGQLAKSLNREFGVKTAVGGYHSVRRDDKTWIFEADGSLEAESPDNLPVEIVSPPMPLPETIDMLPKFFAWAAENGAKANESTGFHMSVSLPEHKADDIDFVKLALFLGDKYVLDTFERAGNNYCRSAFDKIKGRAKEINIEEAFEKMRQGLNSIASASLSSSSGFGKYTSINPKTGYIEFRSAGGENYFEDLKRLQNTLLRYSYALSIASEPKLEKQEYTKKLYKMLESVQTVNPDVIQLFSKYVGGVIPRSALKSHLKALQYDREVIRRKGKFNYDDSNMPPLDWNGKYQIYNISSPDHPVYEFNVDTDDQALAALAYWRRNIMSPNLDPYNFSVRLTKSQDDRPRVNQQWQLFNVSTGAVGDLTINAPTREEAEQEARRYFARIGSSGQGWQVRPRPETSSNSPAPWPFPEGGRP